MTRYLLDLNVFLALILASHESHAAAHRWFTNSGHRAWASNAVTQLGVIRLLTNPVIARRAISADSALNALLDEIEHPGHEFWPLDFDIGAALQPMAGRISGHQQWTDALLLAQAARHRGVLVTFDSGLRDLARAGFEDHLLVLKPR